MEVASEKAPATDASVARGADKFTTAESRTPNERLQTRRRELGLSQQEFAHRVGLTKGRYAGIENGCQRAPSLDRAQVIASALGSAVDKLFDVHECDCGCGELTLGRFVSGHNSRSGHHGDHVRRGHQARRKRLGIPEEKTCIECGRAFTFSEVNQTYEHWLQRQYCSHSCAHGPPIEPQPCLSCGRMFKPADRGPQRGLCSRACAARKRWRDLKVPEAMLRQLPPRARQVWFGRKAGRFGKLGGRPRGSVTETQRVEIVTLAAQGWGRRAIANRLLVSERAVRNILG